jgi:hypothetical protein
MKLWKTRLSGRTEEKEVINRRSKPRRKPRMNMVGGREVCGGACRCQPIII